MRVFVTGATGYVGGAVAERLMQAGHDVAALARSDAAAERVYGAGMQPVRGGLADVQVLADACAAADAVVHCAIEGSRDAVLLDRAVVETVLEALEGTGKPFVYTSGTAVVGDTRGRVSDESTPVDESGPVAWRAAHEALVTVAAERGVRGIVIRPSLVYGRGGNGIVNQQVDVARAGRVVRYVGTGANRWSTVHVDDLADLYLLAVERAPAGSLWVAEGGETVSMADLAEAASRAGGGDGRTQSLSPEEARAALGWMARMLTLNLTVSSARARNELGWRPHRPTLREELRSGSYAADAEARDVG
jgi:nucleoside-diphosphate-sugar epimerase